MSTMPVTDSLPPTPPSYLNVWSEELCAQTELFPLRVIMAANRWGLGCESLGDAGREMSYVLTFAEVLPKTEVAL
jgi:hypothetical protein